MVMSLFSWSLSARALPGSSVRVPAGQRVVSTPAIPKQVIVCTNSSCRKKGGRKTLELFKSMSPEEVEIIEQNCLDECPMGPNCGIGEDPISVINGVKTKDQVADVLRKIGAEPLDVADA